MAKFPYAIAYKLLKIKVWVAFNILRRKRDIRKEDDCQDFVSVHNPKSKKIFDKIGRKVCEGDGHFMCNECIWHFNKK